jgi:hypothetical protein
VNSWHTVYMSRVTCSEMPWFTTCMQYLNFR